MTLAERRKSRGWSQEDLALHSGLSVRTIQRIENGNPASLESLKCLAAVFETSVTDLVQEPDMTHDNSHDYPESFKEKEAIAYIQNLKVFHMNWISALVVIPIMTAFNLLVTPAVLWVVYLALAWGAAIILHAFVIFGGYGFFGARWEQKQFRKRMNKD